MIELGPIEEYDVEVVAVIGVKRIIRVKAGGESHARIVAKDQVGDETSPQQWVSIHGETVLVDPESITQLLTGMCPKKVL